MPAIALVPEIKTQGEGGEKHARPIKQGDGIYDQEEGRKKKKKSDGEVEGVKVKRKPCFISPWSRTDVERLSCMNCGSRSHVK